MAIRFHTDYKKNAGYVLVNTGEDVLLIYHDKISAVEKGEFVKDKGSHAGSFAAFAATLASFNDGKINRRFLIEDKKRKLAEISLNVASSLSIDTDKNFLVFDFPIAFTKKSIKIAAFDLL